MSKRFCIVSDGDGNHYVAESPYHDVWYNLVDEPGGIDEDNCPRWAYPCSDFSNVTFSDPEILGEKVE